MPFTLKVIDDEESGCIIPDDQSDRGGIDSLQRLAFAHLCPSGACDWFSRTALYDLAELHGWEVNVRTRKAPARERQEEVYESFDAESEKDGSADYHNRTH